MSDPGRTAGAQETALHPIACPLNMSAPHVPSSEGRVNESERQGGEQVTYS